MSCQVSQKKKKKRSLISILLHNITTLKTYQYKETCSASHSNTPILISFESFYVYRNYEHLITFQKINECSLSTITSIMMVTIFCFGIKKKYESIKLSL